jgi:hypothetical protein
MKKKLKYLRYFSGLFIVVYCIVFALVLSTVFENRPQYNEYKFEYDMALQVIKHLKLILDTYFEITFIQVMMYFVRIKNMKRKEQYIKNRSSKQIN